VRAAAHGAPTARRTLFLFQSRFTKKLEPNFKVVSSPRSARLALSARRVRAPRLRTCQLEKDFAVQNLQKKTQKLLKNLCLLKWPHWLNPTRSLKLSNAAIKKEIE
jgi:hypothetical protein